MTPEQKNEALKMIEKGMSGAAVARFYGVSRQYIHIITPKRLRSVSREPKIFDKNHYKSNNIKARAHSLINTAKRLGVLTPEPCEKCGDVKTEGHHDDYSKPLDVRWLCFPCHKHWHRLNKAKTCTDRRVISEARKYLKKAIDSRSSKDL